ncbi:MAG: TAXI family TRAP transporter solute-binding subunit [Firmicutes bacterium]|nr:TAXI family TRAP transporter solute-binding subunit [Bacillota bacterium]
MRRFAKLFALVILASFMVFSVAGCGGGDNGNEGGADKVEKLAFSTGPQGGTYYSLATGIATTINDKKVGADIAVESTGGSVENARFLGTKQTDIAWVESMVADKAMKGEKWFDGNKVENLRAIAAIIPNTVHFIVKEKSGIESLADLKGKRISMGVQGGSSPLTAMNVLRTFGINEGDVQPQYVPHGEGIQLLKDDRVDAVMIDGATPQPHIIDATSSQQEMRLLSIPEENINELVAEMPFYGGLMTVDAGTYPGIDYDWTSTGLLAVMTTREEIPEDVVYNITKTMFENTEAITNIHKAGRYIQLERAIKGISIPLHPGAEKFYKEKGIL